tara:strand:+ start:51 stop:683 length:633 start_codon:yes stop_codon:yes gene_type:complete
MKIWDIENNFYYKSDKSRINKVVSQFEIFKKSIKIKGAIVECGVFKGASLIRFLTFRDLLKKSKKKTIGFDPFGKFPKQKFIDDVKFAHAHDKSSGFGISHKKLRNILKKKKFSNFNLVKGNIFTSLPAFLKKSKKFKISFLHLDMDVYAPTKFALETLFDKVSKNGLVLIDDYNQVKGATKATNEFIKKRNLKISTLEFDKRLNFIIKK